jgi:hypothetical protein
MPDNFVNQSICDERFTRLLDGIEKTEHKIDILNGTVGDIKTKFEVLITERKYDNQQLVGLVNDKRNEPIQKKMDRRYVIGLVMSGVFAVGGFVIALLKLIVG